MKNRGKVIAAMMAAFSIFSVSSQVLADSSFISMAPLIADVNTSSAGAEVIMPHFVNLDSDNDGNTDRMSFVYDVFANGSTTKLYSTAKRFAPFPAPLCTAPQWQDSWQDPIFARSGKWVITGAKMITECYSQTEGDEDSENTFVYIADVSDSGGVVRVVKIEGASLTGLDLVDANGDSKEDLMVTMIIEKPIRTYARIYIMDLETGQVISNNSYVVGQ